MNFIKLYKKNIYESLIDLDDKKIKKAINLLKNVRKTKGRLFIIGVGLISFLSKRFLNFSFTFISGTILGLVSMICGLYLPFYEIMISFTLLLLGYLILARKQIRYYGLLFTLFGVFHGWAYGAIFSNDIK